MPRAGLDPEAVAALALAVVDDGGPAGFADLTLAAVAQRAHVAVPSLYKHVAGLPALRREVARRCVEQLAATLDEASTGLHGADALTAIAWAIRRFAHEHAGRYAATQSDFAGGHADAALQAAGARTVAVVARVVGEIGVPPERHVDAVRAVRSAVHGFVVLEAGGGFGMPDDLEVSFDYLVTGLVGALTRTSASQRS